MSLKKMTKLFSSGLRKEKAGLVYGDAVETTYNPSLRHHWKI